jgi:hypothetical protein
MGGGFPGFQNNNRRSGEEGESRSLRKEGPWEELEAPSEEGKDLLQINSY